jgi:hypothetical protein
MNRRTCEIHRLNGLARSIFRCALSIRKTVSRFAALGLLLLPGCATLPALPPADLSEPGWTVRSGQALWKAQRDAPEIAGDLLVAIDQNGRSLVQFTKTPFPILIAQTTQDDWAIEFIPQRRSLRRSGRPSSRFIWPHLGEVLLGHGTPPGQWIHTSLKDGRWRFEQPKSGETLEGYLLP